MKYDGLTRVGFFHVMYGKQIEIVRYSVPMSHDFWNYYRNLCFHRTACPWNAVVQRECEIDCIRNLQANVLKWGTVREGDTNTRIEVRFQFMVSWLRLRSTRFTLYKQQHHHSWAPVLRGKGKRQWLCCNNWYFFDWMQDVSINCLCHPWIITGS